MAEPLGQAIGREACLALLRDTGWGVLSTVESDGTAPYAVPVAYAFDGDAIYVAMHAGRKHRALERNPSLCLTVTDVRALSAWRSVVVLGEARWVTDIFGRAAAARAYTSQRFPGGHSWSLADASRLVTSAICRIDVREITGRAQGC